jgi:hypothetical protein
MPALHSLQLLAKQAPRLCSSRYGALHVSALLGRITPRRQVSMNYMASRGAVVKK